MTSKFLIDVDWSQTWDRCEPEQERTYGYLRIEVGGRVATRALDDWSKSVRGEVLVSVYPMALWIASSWWRLRWESLSTDSMQRSLGWRMSHELPAAGSGFVWPRLTFESDGSNVDVRSQPTTPTATEPLQYLESCIATVTGSDFEYVLDTFVDLVLARLAANGKRKSELAELWRAVRSERLAQDSALYRRVEAELGFDPDEGPQDAIRLYIKTSRDVGAGAIDELATAFSGVEKPARNLKAMLSIAGGNGLIGNLNWSHDLHPDATILTPESQSPGKTGWHLAHLVRDHLGIADPRVDDKTLADLLGVTSSDLLAPDHSTKAPAGLAIRGHDNDKVSLFFRRLHPTGRRFEAARFLADSLLAPGAESWLVTTDSKTARQKAQRAFAAEFLCPIASLAERLDGNFSDEAIEDAGDRFGVSALAVKSHLANNGFLSFESLPIL